MIPEINPLKEVRWPKERLANFTDSIFAFAITLLVLNIMETTFPAGDQPLLPNLIKHSSVFATYMLTFLIVSRFWISHTRLFALIREYDRTIIDLNIALLFFITLFPFAAIVFGNHMENRDAVIIYAGCFASIGIFEYLIGRHVYTHNLLVENKDSQHPALRVFTLYSLSTPFIFIVSIFIAFVSPYVAECTWIFFFFIRMAFRYYYRNNIIADAEVQRL